MKAKYFFLFTIMVVLSNCSNKFVGIHCSEPQNSNLCLNLKKSGEFHYFFADDKGASEGYGEYFVKNKKLHLQFDEYGDQKDSIYFIKKKELADSISIEFIPIDTSFKYCTIDGSSKESWFRLNYDIRKKKKLYKVIYFDSRLDLSFYDSYGHKNIYFSIKEPGEYEVYFKLKKGADRTITNMEKIFDIKKNTKEELVIHLGDSLWKWNLKKNEEGYIYKHWRPYFRKRIAKNK